MTTPKKRGRENGRRRAVVTVSMPEYDLEALDAIAARLGRWRGRKMSRSAVVRALIDVGARIMAGYSVDRI